MVNIKALNLYGQNEDFFKLVNLNVDFIVETEPDIYDTEYQLFNITLERTYDRVGMSPHPFFIVYV